MGMGQIEPWPDGYVAWVYGCNGSYPQLQMDFKLWLGNNNYSKLLDVCFHDMFIFYNHGLGPNTITFFGVTWIERPCT